MAGRKVVWTMEAVRQRRKIMEYWEAKTRSSSYPTKISSRISITEKTIVRHPEIYKRTEFPYIREAAMGDFSLYYKIDEGLITVLAFWDNRQDPDKLDSLVSDSVCRI